jgi:hypothetical protein
MKLGLPTLAVLLGLAGLIPFIGCGLLSVSVAEPMASFWLRALIFYGAASLSFLGGVHWGLALADPRADPLAEPAPERDRLRFGLGVLPTLIGWAALLSTLLVMPEVALAILIAGFAATVLAETRLKRSDMLPSGYLWLRWTLTAVVLATLVTVLVLRLIGAHIVPGY